MSNGPKMKIAFPMTTLPANFGGRRAIILFSRPSPKDPFTHMAVCIDENGVAYNGVPMSLGEIKHAAEKPCVFMEVENERAPLAGAKGIVE